MKKRHFLQTGAAFLGVVALSRTLSQRTNAQGVNTPGTQTPGANAQSSLDTAAKADATSATGQFEIQKTASEWREILTPEAYSVLREHDTEPPYSSPLNKIYEPGIYSCAGCGQPLYSSETKFESGTGWPSFYAALEGAIGTSVDNSFLMTRTEVHCDRCGGHLGHIFNDGPPPTGKRHCLNGVALSFEAA